MKATLSTNERERVITLNTKQAQNLSLIFRQMCGVVKRSIDEIADLADSALLVIADEKPDSIVLASETMEKRLLNKTEIAERLGVCVRTISNLQNEGLPVRRLRKRIQFDYEEVLEWTKDREIKSRRKNNLRMVG